MPLVADIAVAEVELCGSHNCWTCWKLKEPVLYGIRKNGFKPVEKAGCGNIRHEKMPMTTMHGSATTQALGTHTRCAFDSLPKSRWDVTILEVPPQRPGFKYNIYPRSPIY